jgi:hypothetical protein
MWTLPEIITAHRNPADPPEALDKKAGLTGTDAAREAVTRRVMLYY